MNSINSLYLPSASNDAPTVVFVHGFPLDHSMWKHQHLLQSHANLIIPDLPGFGKSAQIEDLSMQSLADQIVVLLDNLGIQEVVYCGLSMGGYVGWEFVGNHSDRLTGLICCNTRAKADDEATARARRIAASQVLKTGVDPVAEAMRTKLFSPKTIQTSPKSVATVTAMIRKTLPETIAAAQLAMASRADHCSILGEIDVPTLVVAGADDSITPSAEMEEMANRIPRARFVEIPAAGHLSPFENASEFNSLVANWLTK